ncbi:MAG: iron complex outermembrane receptor protein [Saprospiraceae bacterium]|jgi:iron complex outermembrane receptor protein
MLNKIYLKCIFVNNKIIIFIFAPTTKQQLMMKKITFNLMVSFLLMSAISFAQGTVTGTVSDSDLGGSLSGANIIEEGANNGAIADFDGNFSLNVTGNSGTIVISYLGYTSTSVSYTLTNGTANLGTVSLEGDANALDEVVVIGTGVIDLAAGRATPVAVSSISGREIQLKATGNVEFTEALKNTPSVYVANQAGGFGDSQIFLRGYDQTNTAFLLNGQPINGMEDGRMYWSNWSGMSDVANVVEIQRGLGSSKLAISSVGGTVNIVSKTTNKKEGGFARFLAGNDSYFKSTVSYDSGLNESGWAFSVLVDHWQAHRKYSIGTAGQGQNYMFSVGYKPNDKHALNFLITGAPQWHDQNFSDDLEDYELLGQKQNANSGFLDGERYTERRNYYHKPVANLNWDFNINESMDLSTVLYASWGRGGGTGGLGSGRVRNDRDEIDFDQIVENNIANADADGIAGFGGSYVRRASVNNHNWYGLLSNLNIESNDWTFNVGVDSRLYHGDHFRQINDLLGLSGFNDNYGLDRPDDYVITEEFEADPWGALFNFADDDQRYSYNYSEDINYIGGFGQIEYANDNFSVFVQGAFSSQTYQREGHFADSDGEGKGKSDKLSKTGYNVKGGLSYNFNENHTIFANAGLFSRQPFLDNIFTDIRRSNDIVKPDVDNEEILGFEAGYRFKNQNLKVNVDFYHTEWGNRFVQYGTQELVDGVETFFTNRLSDVSQKHMGFETDVAYRPGNGIWKLHWYTSVGNWKYDGESPRTKQNDETNEFVTLTNEESSLDLSGTKVGNAPQTSTGLGLTVNICESLSVDGSYNIYSDLYEFVDADDVVDAATSTPSTVYQPERLDSYTLGDVGLTYKFKLGNNKLTFRGNVYNVFNTAYVNQRNAFGYYLGNGRTFNGSLKFQF